MFVVCWITKIVWVQDSTTCIIKMHANNLYISKFETLSKIYHIFKVVYKGKKRELSEVMHLKLLL